MHGLMQAPWAWYAKIDNILLDIDFTRCHFDLIVYTNKVGDHLTIFVFYVDDPILIGSDPKIINHVNSSLKNKFEMI